MSIKQTHKLARYDAVPNHSSLRRARRLTFDLQDQGGAGVVADEALGGDAPQVRVPLGADAHSAAGHDDGAAGRQEELLQQLQRDTRGVGSSHPLHCRLALAFHSARTRTLTFYRTRTLSVSALQGVH